MCTPGCQSDAGEPCPEPYTCEPTTLVSGSTSACLPPSGWVTRVGSPCTANEQCGSARGVCIKENMDGPRPSGLTAWMGGYCSQPCGTGHPECPSGSACLRFESGLQLCMQTCRAGIADCRAGYTCFQASEQLATCLPRCGTDVDCGTGAQCRTCDGSCVSSQTPGATLGDRCTQDGQCGAGQLCGRFGGGGDGVCTQRCENLSCSCPGGSACQQVGPAGERYCLRSCPSGTCATGLQCAPLGGGSACMPACRQDSDCPVPYRCSEGTCTNPFASDAGTCALCQADAGTPVPSPVPDAGTAAGSNGGCGCQGGGAGALLWGVLLLALLSARRKSRP
jgi:uncharacterized protein (TIGR03382 family)